MNEHIPIVMARKPIKTSVAKNVQKYGTGALNIDECRVGNDKMTSWQCKSKSQYTIGGTKKEEVSEKCVTTQVQGRFPSNVLGEIPEHQKYFFNPQTATTPINSENNMKYQVIQGNNIDTLKNFPDNHFDSIVTDPPYGIDFLGKEWDAHTGEVSLYKECLRVLKPGGHILAFSAARTYHKLATSIEEAGFEIRDQIMWIYSSGFPKSQDVGKSIDRSKGLKGKKGPLKRGAERMICQTDENGNRDNNNGVWSNEVKREPHIILPVSEEAKQWAGWGTALKPAHEPIVMARKPIKTSVAKNVQKYGTGALNIDECRIEFTHGEDPNAIFAGGGTDWTKAISQEDTDERATLQDRKAFSSDKGRFPSNVLGEIPEYQKYFYQPKVSRKERHVGFDDLPKTSGHNNNKNSAMENLASVMNREDKGNNHPTVKPVELMKYLIKLVTPPNGKVLDPFNGSGSTGMAAVSLGHEYVGLELDPNYVDISIKRIEAYNKPDNNFDEIFE